MLRAFRLPIGWRQLTARTAREAWADNCPNLAAQLAFYFFLALFPALLFLVSLISFLPVNALLEGVTSMLAPVAPGDVIKIVQEQILKIANDQNGGLLTFGMLGTIWSMSSGMDAIIGTLNTAYDIQESRPWWKTKLTAIGLTIVLAVFIVLSLVLVLVGPILGEKIAAWFSLGNAFAVAWRIIQWPVVFGLVTLAVASIFYYAPDAEREWTWITPGSVLATTLWILISLGFKFYVTNFTSYNATYGTIGGVIVLMLWFYVSSLAVLAGAELNAEIEHASPYGKDPGEKKAGVAIPTLSGAKGDIGPGHGRPADADRRGPASAAPAAASAISRPLRATDWILGGLFLGQAALIGFVKLRSRLRRLNS